MYVFPEVFLYGPGYGIYLVLLGGIIAAVASPSLRVRTVPRA
jgi:hypothetical protein